jgi:divalent metal cation (Fe/Co/Zn/Cd) transporter
MTWDSLELLFSGEIPAPPAWPALLIAAASILANEVLFFYTLKVGKENQSNLIIANAWHHRTDSLSSVVVLVALGGAILGIWWLDALTAVLVALLIAKIGVDLLLKSLAELVDTGLPADRIEALEKTARSVEGVINVHHVRTRLMGGQSLLEMHLQVAPHTTASEGHYIGDNVCNALKEAFDDISYIIYHIDTYDDEKLIENGLPRLQSRKQIKDLLDNRLETCLGLIPDYQMMLFYTPTSLDVEIKLTAAGVSMITDKQMHVSTLQQHLEKTLLEIKGFRKLTVWVPADDRN